MALRSVVVDPASQTWLTYPKAAQRVKSSVGTIHRWRRDGMPMELRTGVSGFEERVVRLDVLLAWWRDRMTSSPVNYYRMRQKAREAGLPDPPMPDSVRAALEASKAAKGKTRERVGSVRKHSPLVASRTDPDVSGDEGVQSWPRERDPLANLAPMKGGPEYGELMEAMAHVPPACADVDAFTADRIDDDTAVMLASICADCPLIEKCRAFVAVSQPRVGFWAGNVAR